MYWALGTVMIQMRPLRSVLENKLVEKLIFKKLYKFGRNLNIIALKRKNIYKTIPQIPSGLYQFLANTGLNRKNWDSASLIAL